MNSADAKPLAVVCLGLLVASVATAAIQRPLQNERRETLEKALDEEKIEGLSVSVEGSTVGLSGKVRNVFHKNEALQIALSQPDVTSVDADIEISTAESDQKLGEEVVGQLRRYTRFTVFDDVNAYVQEGRVALVGWVTEPYKKRELENKLHDVLGIQDFRNDIQVLPTSSADERLRQVLANKLYRDESFADFATMVIPPVHIIVERSRVILTGVVRSQLLKQKAEAILRGTPGVLSVDNRLVVAR